MAKFVRVRIFHAGNFSNPEDQVAQAVGVEWAFTPVGKLWCLQIIPIFSLNKVTPEYPAGTLSNKYRIFRNL